MEAKYHLRYLVKLRNRYRSLTRKQSQKAENTDEKMNESRAFVELSSYIEISVNSGTLLFKLSEIHSLYVTRLEALGVKKQVNKTRLKVYLLERFPEAQEQYDGRNTVLIFKEGMRNMLEDALATRDICKVPCPKSVSATLKTPDLIPYLSTCDFYSHRYLLQP